MTDKETNLTPEVMESVEKQIGGAVRRLGEEGMTPLDESEKAWETETALRWESYSEQQRASIFDAVIKQAFTAGEKAGREAAVNCILVTEKFDHHCKCEGKHFVSFERNEYDRMMKEAALKADTSDNKN